MSETAIRPLSAENLAALPGLRHGFFTRQGGVSEGIYASLNVGFGSDDDAGNVVENRRRAMAALDRPADALHTVHQVHGTTVVRVGDEGWDPRSAPKADALVSDRPGTVLGILTADCVPVLLADCEAGVIGAAHAGWRGAVGGVVEAAVAGMEALGAARRRIHVAVGPAIAQDSYEVGPEFPASFLERDSGSARYFRPSARGGHHMFDLPGWVVDRLGTLGLASVAHLAHDTCAESERFFSYRRATHVGERDYGRGLSAISFGD